MFVGRVRVEGGPLAVTTPAGEVPVPAEGDVEIRAVGPAVVDPAAFADDARRRIRGEAPAAGPVLVVDLRPGGELLALGADGTWATAARPPEDERREIDRLVADLRVAEADLDLEDEASLERIKNAKEAPSDLLARLEKTPAAWDYASTVLAALRPGAERPDVLEAVIRVLVRDPDLHAADRLRDLLAANSAAFDANALLALAERGFEPALPRLRALLTAPPGFRSVVYPAAFFAFRGDPIGRPVLVRAAAFDLQPRNVDLRLAAAAGLAVLGDRQPWRDAVDDLTREVEAHLAAGRLPNARWLALRAAYFHRVLTLREPVSVAYMSSPVARWEQERQGELPDAAAVRALVRSLRE